MKRKKWMMVLIAFVYSGLMYLMAQDTLSVKEVVVKHADKELSNGEIHIFVENGVPPFEYTLSTTKQKTTTKRVAVFNNLKPSEKYWIVVRDHKNKMIFKDKIRVLSNKKLKK